jgi:hypothetical protein
LTDLLAKHWTIVKTFWHCGLSPLFFGERFSALLNLKQSAFTFDIEELPADPRGSRKCMSLRLSPLFFREQSSRNKKAQSTWRQRIELILHSVTATV